jgi:hypothetical protein
MRNTFFHDGTGSGENEEMSPSTEAPDGIGTLKESSLHAGLKHWYALPGDKLESPLDGYWIDIVRGRLLIEIQTGSFSAIKPKLTRLLKNYPVRLVYPVPREKWIVRVSADGKTLGRRKSPKRGQGIALFQELVRIPKLVAHRNLTLEVLFTQEEEIRRDDGRGSRRKKYWSIADRRLLAVVDRQILVLPQDYLYFLPQALPERFTVRELSKALGQPYFKAGQMAYCLRHMGAIEAVGKRSNAILYYANPSMLGTEPSG